MGAVVGMFALLPACACGGSAAAQNRGVVARTSPTVRIVPVDESLAIETIEVNQSSAIASSTSTRTQRPAFQTISAAVEFADSLIRRGIGAKILIHPGIYREQISLSATDKGVTAPLVIEGAPSTVISGADVWTGWQQQGTPGVWVHPWPYQWGYAPYPPGWEGNVVLAPIVTRREMVIVNGTPLRQVLSSGDLTAGTFLVSESSRTITVMVDPQTDLSAATVEVAVRSPLFQAQGRQNLALRGLTFQYANSALPDSAVQISNSWGVVVQNCNFIWNNWDGIDVLESANVTISGVSADNDGGSGMGGYEIQSLLLDSSDTSSNNWRGAMGGFTGWAVAGSKFSSVHNGLVRAYTSRNNQARGFWLDFDTANVTIDASRFEGNLRDGVFLEADQGPLSVTNSRMCGSTTGAGIAGSNTANVQLTGNVICDNSQAQLLITGDPDRTVTDFQSGNQFDVRAENWTLCGNTMLSKTRGQASAETPNWPWFFRSLDSDWNMWSSSGGAPNFALGGQNMSITGWRNATNQDLNSLVATDGISLPVTITRRLAHLCSTE
jgi:Right handed beta helix region